MIEVEIDGSWFTVDERILKEPIAVIQRHGFIYFVQTWTANVPPRALTFKVFECEEKIHTLNVYQAGKLRRS